MSTGVYSVIWTRWYTIIMSNAILPLALAVFAVGSKLVRCLPTTEYILHQEILRTGGVERNEVRPPVSHAIMYLTCSKVYIMVYIPQQYF